MSGGIVPSKTTVYLSNMPFSLTNNDLHKVLTKYGTLVKVTVVKDKITRRSKGYAFAQYLRKEDADACVAELNNTVLFGRTVKSSIAIDNGRSAEFIRRRVYADKSFCYECGVEGHLSYQCPKNSLGERPVPNKKKQKRKKERDLERGRKKEDWEEKNNSSNDEIEEADLETLSSAIHFEQMKHANRGNHEEHSVKRKKYSRNAYFSDEEDISD